MISSSLMTLPSPPLGSTCQANPLTQSVSLIRKPQCKATIFERFSELTDPRLNRKKRHLLEDIIVFAICSIISGANDWVGIEKFSKAKYQWFKQFLSLANGIPSHDTFDCVFSLYHRMNFKPASPVGFTGFSSKPKVK